MAAEIGHVPEMPDRQARRQRHRLVGVCQRSVRLAWCSHDPVIPKLACQLGRDTQAGVLIVGRYGEERRLRGICWEKFGRRGEDRGTEQEGKEGWIYSIVFVCVLGGRTKQA